MKHIYEYLIWENNSGKNNNYKYSPNTTNELVEAIETEIKLQGNNADLNCIDTSKITDMSHVFSAMYHGYAKKFNGDISGWDVSNVEYMIFMFEDAEKFNGDISKWDVSNVKRMDLMFSFAESFNQDISKWDVHKVEDMSHMFSNAKSFNQDISKWDVRRVKQMGWMFDQCPIKDQYKPKF